MLGSRCSWNSPRVDRLSWGALVNARAVSNADKGRVPFVWHSFDLRPELPEDWQAEILKVARTHSRHRDLIPTSVTSREATRDLRIPVATVGGVSVAEYLPWLNELYHTRFLELGQSLTDEQVFTASDQRFAVNLNVQEGSEQRYECHVDSNPLEGLLYVTSHPVGMGGELVVSNRGNVRGKEEVDEDATRIHPVAGHLIFFDARQYTHYVAPLVRNDDIRVVAAMIFYTPSSPESARPSDLDQHLYGSD
jgi:hypothetical protein